MTVKGIPSKQYVKCQSWGVSDRLTREGLLKSQGCEGAGHVYIWKMSIPGGGNTRAEIQGEKRSSC